MTPRHLDVFLLKPNQRDKELTHRQFVKDKVKRCNIEHWLLKLEQP
jgi:hypothetical protein